MISNLFILTILFLAIACNSSKNINSDNDNKKMKKKTLKDITFYDLSDKEKERLIETKKVISIDSSLEFYDALYSFSDSSVLIEKNLEEIYRLFNNRSDFEKYTRYLNEASERDFVGVLKLRSRNFNDENNIYLKELLLNFNIDTTQGKSQESIKQIDKLLLVKSQKEEIIKNYSDGLLAFFCKQVLNRLNAEGSFDFQIGVRAKMFEFDVPYLFFENYFIDVTKILGLELKKENSSLSSAIQECINIFYAQKQILK